MVPFTGPREGYFALLLKRNPAASVVLQDSFLSTLFHRTDDNIEAFLLSTTTLDMPEPDYLFYYSNATEDVDYVDAWIDYTYGSDVMTNLEGTYHYVGQHVYTQWGYWMSSSPTIFTLMSDGPITYQFVQDKVWFVEGKAGTLTTMEQIDNIALTKPGEYNYGGVALGTYFDPTTTADLSGTFNSKVVFGSATITEFNLTVSGKDVSGVDHTVNYGFTGSVPVSAWATGNMFNIGSGTATIDGVSATCSAVNGSLYGPKAEEMAGVWGVNYRADPYGYPSSADKGAAGIFAGKQISTNPPAPSPPSGLVLVP